MSRYLLFRPLILSLFFGLVGGIAAASGDVPNPPVTSVGPGQQFAIADFDGDMHPDLASIQAGPNSSGTINYWIELQLSVSGLQTVRLLAPAGGLRVEARDVNGDHAVDLIFSTAWFREPVAILLNDGHGKFSRVEPTTFPSAFGGSSNTNWGSASNQAADAVGSIAPSRTGICPDAGELLHGRSRTSSILFSSAVFLVNPFLIFHAGRAPPSEVPPHS